ncbi:MAG: DUF5362 family protein [Actinobacteria bacterium]|nr:DUF5362 family protein [Actinomycetota bacterium]
MIDKETLSEFRRWSDFAAILTIILGVISALIGVFSFVIGAIPGIIIIILGVKLLNAKKKAEELLAANADEDGVIINSIFMNLNTYFKLQGFLIIAYFVIMVLFIIFAIFLNRFLFNMLK